MPASGVDHVGHQRSPLSRHTPRSPRRPHRVRAVAPRSNVFRPLVARYLGAGRLRSRTFEAQGLTLPAEVLEAVAAVPYAAGVAPYLSLLPLITDRHVDALTLAGTIEEVADHIVALTRAGIDGIIILSLIHI